jgi:hypothetical protein
MAYFKVRVYHMRGGSYGNNKNLDQHSLRLSRDSKLVTSKYEADGDIQVQIDDTQKSMSHIKGKEGRKSRFQGNLSCS